MTLPRSARVALLAGAAALALVPLSGDRFWLQFAGKLMITCLFAVSLDLLVGYAGLVSLAHSAFFGLSAYLLAALGIQLGLDGAGLLGGLPGSVGLGGGIGGEPPTLGRFGVQAILLAL